MLGQIYMDVSTKHAPDDFGRDLRKLELASECVGCLERDRCAGEHAAKSEDVFSEAEAHVRRRVRELEGDVLDVGAGHAPYASELAANVHRQRVRYLAVDPDAERLTLLRERFPWAETRVSGIEPLVSDARRFHAILFLRSYNHLPDPGSAISAAAELLLPGGTLLVVDDVAFGLVRSREQVERAEASPTARFEHYRNDSSDRAHAVVEAVGGFNVLERRDVLASGSNQWLLRYRRLR